MTNFELKNNVDTLFKELDHLGYLKMVYNPRIKKIVEKIEEYQSLCDHTDENTHFVHIEGKCPYCKKELN